MNRSTDILLTALAPTIWGSTYIVTTELLPPDLPLTSATIRALPAGLILLLINRQLPSGTWWWKVTVLAALNFSIFWWLLFVAAYRLPGGVAATLGATQPLVVVFASRLLLATPIRTVSIFAAIAGIVGVALLLLTPEAGFDLIGVIAGLGGAIAMALGVVLTRKWQPDVPLLTFTAWQLVAGGLLLAPFAFFFEPGLGDVTSANIVGYVYLSVIGAAFTYVVWFRGIARLDPNTVSPLGFLSPTMAVILGWLILDQSLDGFQMLGIAIVLTSIWLTSKVRAEGS